MGLWLRQHPDPILETVCPPVEKVSNKLRKKAFQMYDLMKRDRGIGLAGPQAGIPFRIFVTEVPGDLNEEGNIRGRIIINPELEFYDRSEEVEMVEGCLSFPGVRRRISRPSQVICRYKSLDWSDQVIDAEGLLARCILHEVDHLDGVLFTTLGEAADAGEEEDV